MLLRFLPIVVAFVIFSFCVLTGYPLDYPLVHPYGYDTVFSLKLQSWGASESASMFWNIENPSPVLIMFGLLAISPVWMLVVKSHRPRSIVTPRSPSPASAPPEVWNTPSSGGFIES